MDFFAKIVNGWKPLTIFAKSFIFDVWMVSEYDSEGNAKILYKRIRDLLFCLQILAIFLKQVLLDCATHFKMFYQNISYTTLRLQTKEN